MNLRAKQKLAPFVAEIIGTFFLVLTIGLTSVQKQPLAPVAVGFMYAALVATSSSVSGGHFNPAVTAGVWLSKRGKLTAGEGGGYVASQFLGAIVAVSVYGIAIGDTYRPLPGPGFTWMAAGMVELFYSAGLAFVILNSSTVSWDTKSNFQEDFTGLAAGLFFLAAAAGCGSVSGCCLNPAAAFAMVTSDAFSRRYQPVSSHPFSSLCVYMICPLLGSVIAAALFRLVRPVETDYSGVDFQQLSQDLSSPLARPPSRSRNYGGAA